MIFSPSVRGLQTDFILIIKQCNNKVYFVYHHMKEYMEILKKEQEDAIIKMKNYD